MTMSALETEPRRGRGRPNPAVVVGLTLVPIVGALWGPAVPWVVIALIGVAGLAYLSPHLLVVALALLVGVRADAQLEALAAASSGPISGQGVTVISDPREGAFGQWAIVARGEERLVASAGAFSSTFASAEAGDRLIVASGSVIGRAPTSNWEVSNRLVGSLRIGEIAQRHEATGVVGLANRFRQTLADGARSLSPQRKALLAGLTVGDDRGQSAATADNFRAAGLGHLLAVSGQNVVFVLLVTGPLLKRIRHPVLQVLATVAVLTFFGFVTRFEPSVTRALAMVSLAVLATALGRPAGAARTLPIAVGALLLWDPLLAWSLAFQLSVAATLGLIVIAPALQDRLRGPEVFRSLLSATIGAQVAVAPLLALVFDDVSLVALPANLLAVPVSGVIMMWGMTAGLIAGFVPDPLAAIIHLPTNVLLWWLETVAARSATLPVAPLGVRGVVLAGTVGLVFAGALRFRFVPVRLAALGLVVALGVPLLTPQPLPVGYHQFGDGLSVVRHHSGADLVVLTTPRDAEAVLASLRKARLGRIDLVVAVNGSRDNGRVVRAIDERYDLVDIWAPVGHQVPNARAVPGLTGTLGDVGVRVHPDGVVEVFDVERGPGLIR